MSGIFGDREHGHGGNSVEPDLDFTEICWRSSAAIWVIQNEEIIYANPKLAKLLDLEIEAILGSSPQDFLHGDDRPWFRQRMEQRLLGTAEVGPQEVRLVCCNGSVLDVELLDSRLNYDDGLAYMATMIDITGRKQAESAMQERIEFERMLAELSAAFINLPADEIDGQINESLRRLVDFMGNDRSSLVEFDDDDDRYVQVTYSIAADGCEPFRLGPFAGDRLPWFIGQFRQGRTVFLRDTATDLPAEATKELDHCRVGAIQSNVTVPLMVGGEVLGGLTFAFVRQRCHWPASVISRLKLVGEVFANALTRKRTEQSLNNALAENEQLRLKLEQENQYLREQVEPRLHHERIVGRSAAVGRMLVDAERVAPTEASVLLLGETGTGKELLAQAIHEMSDRNSRRMITVNCASLPATLIESELFGRAEGGYTGSASAQIGRFELADQSTLFLDEVGELPLELQAKLLRVLQDGEFERLGSPATISVDVRLIAATNRDLEQAVHDHAFRADLYYRLNVFPIQLPPLRERSEDIPPLVWSFVEKFGKRMGKAIKKIPAKAMQRLQQYSWPGNIRELSNVIERAMILATDDTLHIEIPAATQQPAETSLTLKESQKQEILRTLRQTGWRIRGVGGTAERLGSKPTTLEARMARLGIKRPSTHK